VLWTGAKPIYVDIDDSLNFDTYDADTKMAKNVKAIIVQHTFGNPADMTGIMQFVKKHNILLIEDCAHSLGATFQDKQVGTFGDAAIFSFGRDKVLSSVFGGVAIIHKSHDKAIQAMKHIAKRISMPSLWWVGQQILHPILFAVILPLYRLQAGKLILVLFQRIGFLSKPVYDEEKTGCKPDDFPALYPNGLAILLLTQLKKLELYNNRRVSNSHLYQKLLPDILSIQSIHFRTGSIFLRYPLLVSDADAVSARARKRGILLGNWYRNVIDPVGVDFNRISYIKGSCPKAETVSGHIVNFPTLVTGKEAQYISRVIS